MKLNSKLSISKMGKNLLTVAAMLLLLSETSFKTVHAEEEEEFEPQMLFGSDIVSKQIWLNFKPDEIVEAKDQYKWNPDDGEIEIVYSDKTVVEMGKNDNIKNSEKV